MQSSMQHALALMTVLADSWCIPAAILLRAQRVRAVEYASQS
jgi:hypothetical protein